MAPVGKPILFFFWNGNCNCINKKKKRHQKCKVHAIKKKHPYKRNTQARRDHQQLDFSTNQYTLFKISKCLKWRNPFLWEAYYINFPQGTPLMRDNFILPKWVPPHTPSYLMNWISTQVEPILSWSYRWIEIHEKMSQFIPLILHLKSNWYVFLRVASSRKYVSNGPHPSGPHKPTCTMSCMCGVIQVKIHIYILFLEKIVLVFFLGCLSNLLDNVIFLFETTKLFVIWTKEKLFGPRISLPLQMLDQPTGVHIDGWVWKAFNFIWCLHILVCNVVISMCVGVIFLSESNKFGVIGDIYLMYSMYIPYVCVRACFCLNVCDLDHETCEHFPH